MIDLRFAPIEKWPGEPTRGRMNATFRATYGATLDLLEFELQKLHAKEITIQAFLTHGQLRNDGWPLSKAVPSQPGLILSFKTKSGALSFPCDRYRIFDDNLRAIALSLQALRAVDRYGVTKSSEQYTGWKRIDAPTAAGFQTKEDAASFIGVQAMATNSADPLSPQTMRSLISDPLTRQAAYRAAARRLHPDAPTGNHELFVKLQQTLAMLEKAA